MINQFEEIFLIKLNHNQSQEISRLLKEITKRDKSDISEIINKLHSDPGIKNSSGKNKFFHIKHQLLNLRFPLTTAKQKIDPKQVFLPESKSQAQGYTVSKTFIPEKICIERKAKDSPTFLRFTKYFPDVPVEELDSIVEYSRKNKFSLKNLKKPLVFIVKERWDFIKPCPCTKNHLGCNYWIFNLGFGCPFDCSYCFLQQYTNFPGIVLPANLNDFFDKFDDFYKKINRPIRIGTGEFCDSLALDHITEYSTQLINFFKDKPVFFELKTKSNNVENILKIPGAKNIVISWSLNPQSFIDSEEICVASLDERLAAAKKVQDAGYSLSFHFDPIVYLDNWKILYQEVIEKIYSKLKAPFAWISLGTLRGTRKLKNAAEQRFPESSLWYGELFLGTDKKLRYPKFMRKEIYSQINSQIRKYDSNTPVYLCMEDIDCWQTLDTQISSTPMVERYLLKNL